MAGGALEQSVGLPVGGLDLDPINQATEGSSLSRTFTVNAGDVLSFDWQLLTRDNNNADYAFLTINGQELTLASASDATLAADGLYLTETSPSTFQYVFTSAGTENVSFGVTDVGDYAVSSALVLDNVTVGAVPEPNLSGVALVALCVLGLVHHVRRRTAQATA